MNRERRASSGLETRSEAMASLINQIMFFMLCDRWFCPHERLTGLYALLFYNVICYLLLYAQRLAPAAAVLVSRHSPVRHLALTAAAATLELTRALTFAVTAAFVLLAFGLEQGMEHFCPTWLYVGVTAAYFALTERTCRDKIPSLLAHLDAFQSLENLWTPVLVRIGSSAASGLMIVLVLARSHEHWALLGAASFVNVYLGVREAGPHWRALLREQTRFRAASAAELVANDDVCAVCLAPMPVARITPCRHLFHGECLRRCLQERPFCPMCKHHL